MKERCRNSLRKLLVLLTILTLTPFSVAQEDTAATTTPPADTTTTQPAAEPTTEPVPAPVPAVGEPVLTPVPAVGEPVPVPSEQPAMQVPEGCSLVTDSRGMQVVRCPPGMGGGASCPPPEEMQRKADECMKSGGRVEKHSDQQGCTYVSCAFGDQQYMPPPPGAFLQQQQFSCPPPEEMSRVKEKCIAIGMTAVMKRVGECSFVECAGAPSYRQMPPPGVPGAYPMPPPPVECRPIIRDSGQEEECRRQGGNLVKRFDHQGCTFLECMPGEQAQEFCQREVPKDFFEQCTQRGGEPVSKRDHRGCVVFFNCVMRGDDRSIEYEDVREVPTPAKILEAVLKMERLKMQLTKLGKELESIARYYEDEDNAAEAERFFRAAGMIRSSQEKISSIKEDLRRRAAQLTIQDVMNTKRDLKYITDVLFKDVLYVILGAEGVAEGPEEEGGIADCGSDGRCFEQNFRICKPAKFMPPEERYPPTITIEGLDKEDQTCKLYVKHEMGGDMTCKIPNYAFARLEPQSIIPYCEGPLVEMMKKFGMQQANVQDERTYERQLMGCEKVERGFAGYERGKCGNECCEPALGEGEQDCPKDCKGQGGADDFQREQRDEFEGLEEQGDRGELRTDAGNMAMMISPSRGKTIRDVVTIAVPKVPDGTNVVSFAIQGRGIEDMTKTGPNLGKDTDSSDGWNWLLDTKVYADGVYTVYALAGEGAPLAAAQLQVAIQNEGLERGISEDRRNFERPMPPQYDYAVPMQPDQPLLPAQPMPPGYSAQLPEPTTEFQDRVASTGFAVKALINRLVGEEL